MDLIVRMISMKPSCRPNISEVKEHSWMQGPSMTIGEIKEANAELNKEIDQKEFQKKLRKKCSKVHHV